MAFKGVKFIKGLRVAIPVLFASSALGIGIGFGIGRAQNENYKNKVNEYSNVLKASGEVGTVETKSVLPFGERQFVLTKEYTDEVKNVLEPNEYGIFIDSFAEPLLKINDLKIGYKFTLCSEDGSFGLDKPQQNIPTVNWTIDYNLPETTAGQWNYSKNMFGEDYFYSENPKFLNEVSYPSGLETFFDYSSLNNMEYITVCGQNYLPSRVLTNYKIATHELYHSLGSGHVNDKIKDNIPRNSSNIIETYMLDKINYLYVGDSKFDENTLIAASCLRRILDGSKDKNMDYFDSAHFATFDQFIQKGTENLNKQNQSEM